jgi:effector-binding domain-containing protein
MEQNNSITHKIRPALQFAGIRKPIQEREELYPRIEHLKNACEGVINGPLTHIFRFDTPVDGYDSEIGFPVLSKINSGEVRTNMLRELHTFSIIHEGPLDNLRATTQKLYDHMNKVGLAPELELVEIYHQLDLEHPDETIVEIQASFLAWPEVYREQLLRVLGPKLTDEIWSGGEEITPFTLVDDRVEWVSCSIERLKDHTNQDQQFDILSKVALVRPLEDINKHKKIYDETGDANLILKAQHQELQSGPTGGFIDPPILTDRALHLSKVAYNRKAYDQASTQGEIRKAYCFCPLVREAKDPKVDPIFCYRAAGWARQFWEPILEVEFKTCTITHSILKGDRYCAWDYMLENAENTAP